ncbi:MAG: hypothetical protein ACE5EM_05560 [Sphingomonadales bacterium]
MSRFDNQRQRWMNEPSPPNRYSINIEREFQVDGALIRTNLDIRALNAVVPHTCSHGHFPPLNLQNDSAILVGESDIKEKVTVLSREPENSAPTDLNRLKPTAVAVKGKLIDVSPDFQSSFVAYE